jgi:N-acetylglutamate synthase-like GNAT family acetyltransferase
MSFIVRHAKEDEIEWVNECYLNLQLEKCDPKTDFVAIAENHHRRAGICCLASVSEECVELTGMVVFKPFQRLGVGKALIRFLLNQASGKIVYCIPFSNLWNLYASDGFSNCESSDKIPRTILEKYLKCKKNSSAEVILLQKDLRDFA